MKFESMKHLKLWLRNNMVNMINQGAQGVCYKIGNKVYKIFIEYVYDEIEEYYHEYKKEELLKFKDIINNTYVFPMM